jgi:hypothetical protein
MSTHPYFTSQAGHTGAGHRVQMPGPRTLAHCPHKIDRISSLVPAENFRHDKLAGCEKREAPANLLPADVLVVPERGGLRAGQDGYEGGSVRAEQRRRGDLNPAVVLLLHVDVVALPHRGTAVVAAQADHGFVLDPVHPSDARKELLIT